MGANVTQRDLALKAANKRRMRIVDIKRQALSGRVTLAELVLDPPDELLHWTCVDVVRLQYRTRSSAALERLGRLAVRDRINLLLPIGRTSRRTREWLAEHVSWHVDHVNGSTRIAAVITDDENAA